MTGRQTGILCLCGKEPQEELAAELGVAEEYNEHKLLLRGLIKS